MYRDGEGVEKDSAEKKALLEKAAIAGFPYARNNLAYAQANNGRIDRAVKHWIISAKLGDDQSIKALKACYKQGHVSKDEFASALRAYLKLQLMQ